MTEISLVVEIDDDDSQCAVVLVDGAVAGHHYRFVLDTGASRTQVVADAFIDALETSGEHHSHGVFSPSTQRTVQLPDLEVGPLRSSSIEASVAVDTQGIVHPLIGMDLLKDHRLHFCFDREVLIVDDTPVGHELHPLMVDDAHHLYVEASWPSATARCVWDSGAGMTIVDKGFWTRHRDLFSPVGSSQGTDASGVQQASTTYEVDSPMIGGHWFAPHHVAVVDLAQ
jgi:gag-polyprotein putative aspartyl protease